MDKPLTKTDYVGWAVWLFGFVFEAIADRQKMKFKSNPSNKVNSFLPFSILTSLILFQDRFVDTGLWKYSRHPNYFGEICMWIGLYISSSHMLNGKERWLGLLSPVFTTLLLSFVSGIPLLERRAMKQLGSDSAYLAYRKRTPVLIPFVNFP